jgi:hypothetical protein
MPQIRNTTADMNDPDSGERYLALAIGLATGSPEQYIRAQEKAGQSQLVNSQMLPTKILHGGKQEDFEALGFTFGFTDPDDPLFQRATLPSGWSKQPTDHDMWSKIVDEHGRERVGIFYKAAFYDRSAHMFLASVRSYVSAQISANAPIITDESWATPAAVEMAARAIVSDHEENLEKYRGWAEEDGERNSYWADRIPEVEAERDRALAVARQHGASAETQPKADA